MGRGLFCLRLSPVKKAGAPLGGKIGGGTGGRAAHHTGTRVSHGAAGKSWYLSAGYGVSDNGLVTDYRNKFGVEHSELVLPGGGTCNRGEFWNAVDSHPTRSPSATVARDMIVAFPHEFSFDERKAVAKDLATWIAERYHVAVDYGMHLPEVHKGSSEKNFHGHFLISERTVSPSGELGNVQRQLNQMVCSRIDEKQGRTERTATAAQEIRGAWERIANDALERGGHSTRIDRRTLREQGIDREATTHRGAAATRQMREAQRSTITQSSVRASAAAAELASLARSLKERQRTAADRIEEIQRERRVHVSAHVVDHIGSLDAWQQDAMGQFIRAWESADRASALRRQLREIDRRHLLRAASKDEDRALRAAGRERQRAAKLLGHVEAARESIKRIDPSTVLDVAEKKTGARVRAIQLEAKKAAELCTSAGLGAIL